MSNERQLYAGGENSCVFLVLCKQCVGLIKAAQTAQTSASVYQGPIKLFVHQNCRAEVTYSTLCVELHSHLSGLGTATWKHSKK